MLLGLLGGLTAGFGRLARGSEGTHAEVFVGNERVALLDLSRPHTYTIKGYIGAATVVVDAGKARVTQAPCSGKRCIHVGWLSRTGDASLCVPNRLMVKIAGVAENSADAIVG